LNDVEKKLREGKEIAAYMNNSMVDFGEGEEVIRSRDYVNPRNYAIACLIEMWEESKSAKLKGWE
jgi:hypothetical protein